MDTDCSPYITKLERTLFGTRRRYSVVYFVSRIRAMALASEALTQRNRGLGTAPGFLRRRRILSHSSFPTNTHSMPHGGKGCLTAFLRFSDIHSLTPGFAFTMPSATVQTSGRNASIALPRRCRSVGLRRPATSSM